MKLIAFLLFGIFAVLSYRQWIIDEYKAYGNRAVKCFIEGFVFSMLFGIGWSIVTEFSNVVISTIVGVSVMWILSALWEKYIDKHENLYDSRMRLVTALVPFVVAMLTLLFL